MNGSLKFGDNAFDYVSLVTAIWVMVAHSVAWVFYQGKGGNFPLWRVIAPGPAVAVMFAMSGFLCTASYERSHSLGRFYLKRIARIYPAAIIMIITGELVWIFSGVLKDITLSSGLLNTLKEIAFSAGIKPNGYIGNGAYWTIPRQIQFYILTPILYFLIKKMNRISRGLMLVFGVVINILTPAILDHVSGILRTLYGLSCIPYLYMYILGMILFLDKDKLLPVVVKGRPFWLVAYIIIHWVINVDSLWSWEYINPFSAIIAFLLGTSLAYSFGKHRLKMDISYGIYLWHCFFIDVYLNLLNISNSFVVFILVIISSILLGVVSYLCIERPTLKLIKN